MCIGRNADKLTSYYFTRVYIITLMEYIFRGIEDLLCSNFCDDIIPNLAILMCITKLFLFAFYVPSTSFLPLKLQHNHQTQ